MPKLITNNSACARSRWRYNSKETKKSNEQVRGKQRQRWSREQVTEKRDKTDRKDTPYDDAERRRGESRKRKPAETSKEGAAPKQQKTQKNKIETSNNRASELRQITKET